MGGTVLKFHAPWPQKQAQSQHTKALNVRIFRGMQKELNSKRAIG